MSYASRRMEISVHRLKVAEVSAAFRAVPPEAFPEALELGAGDGYQSSLLKPFCTHLLATDFNPQRLAGDPVPGVEFATLDAEKVDEGLGDRRFDLIFSSSLLEHLPDVDRALVGMRTVLAPGGVCVHILPSVTWKVTQLALWWPTRLLSVALRVARRLRGRSIQEGTGFGLGNNPKFEQKRRFVLLPTPHGSFAGNAEELRAYRVASWRERFERAGFEVLTVRRGPVASGYGLAMPRVARALERMGVASVMVYVLKRTGETSPHERYWCS